MEKSGVAFGLSIVAVVLVAGWYLASVAIVRDAVMVNYSVVETVDQEVEIRQYSYMTLASISSDSLNSAFTALSRYIMGNNEDNTRMDMILPLISQSEGERVNMSFILPEGYRRDNAPQPLNSDIVISDIPSRKVAVLGFSGYAGDSAYEEQRGRLESSLRGHRVQTQGDYFLFRYAPPRSPPVLMRNEVAVEVT
ncbi:MAG: hypothetical protein PWR29_1169 [Methanolobus sp.]|nr:hypothetical protein [Methanolobus sp.]